MNGTSFDLSCIAVAYMCDIELEYLSNKCEHWMGIMEATKGL